MIKYDIMKEPRFYTRFSCITCGEGGIRTPVTRECKPHFECGAFSQTLPPLLRRETYNIIEQQRNQYDHLLPILFLGISSQTGRFLFGFDTKSNITPLTKNPANGRGYSLNPNSTLSAETQYLIQRILAVVIDYDQNA